MPPFSVMGIEGAWGIIHFVLGNEGQSILATGSQPWPIYQYVTCSPDVAVETGVVYGHIDQSREAYRNHRDPVSVSLTHNSLMLS